jgi:uncharacterized protein (TIGR02444 family)
MSRPGEGQGPEEEALWRFSLAFYARAGVADALLSLQDRARRDVNLMLFCLWLGAFARRRLGPAGLAAATAAILPLSDMAARLRALRRELKAASDRDLQDTRRRILGLELAIERRTQRRLASLQHASEPTTDEPLAAAAANLALYLGRESDAQEASVLLHALAALARRA